MSAEAPFVFAREYRGRAGDPGEPGEKGDTGPSGGPFPDLTGVDAERVAVTTGDGGVEFRQTMNRDLVTASSAFGGAVRAWDDFRRADVATLRGTSSPSGHVYKTTPTNDTSENALAGGRYAPLAIPSNASILYATHERTLTGVAAEWVWEPTVNDKTTASTTGYHNAVIGACPDTFGRGSVQLMCAQDPAAYPAVEDVDSSGAYVGNPTSAGQWQLFIVPNVLVDPSIPFDPYPVIAHGVLSVPMVEDGATVYRMWMRRQSDNTVILGLPDGQVQIITHTLISHYWGKVAGWQLRRPYSSDGRVEFTSTATLGDPDPVAAETLTSSLMLSGVSGTAVTSSAPSTSPADVDAVVAVQITDTSAVRGLTAHGSSPLGNRSYTLTMLAGANARKLRFTAYFDGSTGTTYDSTVAAGSTANWYRVTQNHSTGEVKFYTSDESPFIAASTVTWVQLGATVSGTASSVYASTGEYIVGNVTASPATTPGYGRYYYFERRTTIGGTAFVAVDFRRLWAAGTSYTGPYGNTWQIVGTTGYAWLVDPSSIAFTDQPGGFATLDSAGLIPVGSCRAPTTWSRRGRSACPRGWVRRRSRTGTR